MNTDSTLTTHLALQAACVMTGGAAGSMARWALSLWLQPTNHSFPFGTLAANLFGCFAAGVCLAFVVQTHAPGHPLRLLLITGFLGGFTTFSAFALESVQMLRSGRIAQAFTYVMLSVVLGLGLCVAAYYLCSRRAQ